MDDIIIIIGGIKLAILDKWKTVILILLVIILLFYNIGINSKLKRYIVEDKEVFINEIDNLIAKSKIKMDSIISNKDEIYIEYKDIELLKMYHGDLKRKLFGFKKKANYINKDLSDGFQKLSDKYNYEEEINLEDTVIYYEEFLKRIEDNENIILTDDDVYMFERIYNLYNEIRKDINKIM